MNVIYGNNKNICKGKERKKRKLGKQNKYKYTERSLQSFAYCWNYNQESMSIISNYRGLSAIINGINKHASDRDTPIKGCKVLHNPAQLWRST